MKLQVYVLALVGLSQLACSADAGDTQVASDAQVAGDESLVASQQQALTCSDAPPDNRYTCAQQKAWGKCNETWMTGYCQVTCGVCSLGSTNCGDVPPDTRYTCAQQKSWGKCGESWMYNPTAGINYCATTCGHCSGTQSSTAPMTGNPFVAVNGQKFSRYGRAYSFLGANFWGASNLASTGPGGNRARLLRELDRLQAAGVTNLRIMASSEGPNSAPYRVVPAMMTSPGVYDNAQLDGLDFVLSEMKKRNMTAVMVLNNFWHWSGGMAQYVSWAHNNEAIPYPNVTGDWTRFENYAARFYSDAVALTAFRSHVQTIVNRVNGYTRVAYKDDPTIMSWNVANEPIGMGNWDAYNKWVVDTAAYIKSFDAHHLVSTGGGDESVDQVGVDYDTVHIWVQNAGKYDPKNGASYDPALSYAYTLLDGAVARAAARSKPLVLEEFGLARDGQSYDAGTPTDARDRFYASLFQRVYDSAARGDAGVAVAFWAWAGEGRRNASHSSWLPSDAIIGDPPHEPQGWYSVYDTDTSTIQLIKGYADLFTSLNK